MTKLMEHESADRQWFALCDSGQITRLGDCGDFDAAEDIAVDLGINAIWLFDSDTAREWLETLNVILNAEGA